VYFGLLLIPIFLYSESINFVSVILQQHKYYFVATMIPSFLIFFITILAETNRTPFDLPEAEAEIVAGYNVEYAGIVFSLFFLAEYNNIFVSCSYLNIFFFGTYFDSILSEIFFIVKVVFFAMVFILVRGILPRYRYDQLMSIGWKKFLPLSLSLIIFYSFILGLSF